MANWVLQMSFVDGYGGKSSKRFNGVFADYATASAAADALITDIQAVSGAALEDVYLAEILSVAGAAGAVSVFEVVDSTLLLDSGKQANFKIPSPDPGIFVGNILDTANADWLALQANFETGGGWTVSDGETVASTVRGKRAFVASGKTNLS